MNKIKVAVIGPGNIGSDLMYKIFRSEVLEMGLMTGIVESEGIRRAASHRITTSLKGVDAVIEDPDIKLAFDATSAPVHADINGPVLKKAGIISVDLTPAALGPYCVPSVNLDSLRHEQDINMVTCGGQATIPVVHAVNEIAGVSYAEIVACISAKSAGPGTRANIDEFTETTSKALVKVGGADRGKAIIIINPAEPPLMMTNTIITRIKDKNVDIESIRISVEKKIEELRRYVPGYEMRVPPTMNGDKVTTIVQVKGQGDFLPDYSGNLDIINAAAVAAAENLVRNRFLGEV